MEQPRSRWTSLALRRSRPEVEARAAVPELEPLPPVVVDGDCSLEGRLVSDRNVRIEGELRGSVVTSETVLVMEGGTVEGEIQARSIEIRGAVVGNVSGAREVVLHEGAKLHGDVETSSFVVERGAYFNGGTQMRLPQHSTREAPAAPPSGPGV